jgi:hypothetical protein
MPELTLEPDSTGGKNKKKMNVNFICNINIYFQLLEKRKNGHFKK